MQPYPGPGPRVTITNGGAVDPAWSKNSSELFYRAGGGQMMAVPFAVSNGVFAPGKAVPMFQQPALGGGTTVRATYDVSPDGRFLFNQVIAEAAQERNRRIFPGSLRFVVNWTAEVRNLLAPR